MTTGQTGSEPHLANFRQAGCIHVGRSSPLRSWTFSRTLNRRRVESLGGAARCTPFPPHWSYSELRFRVTVQSTGNRNAIAESNHANFSGGFVMSLRKFPWTPPQLSSFANAEEVWEHFKDKGSPEERQKLKALLAAAPRGCDVERRRA